MLPKIFECSLDQILKPGVPHDLVLTGQNGRRFDVAEEIDEILLPPKELAKFTNAMHMFYLEEQKRPLEESYASDKGVKEIYRLSRDYLKSITTDQEELAEWLRAFDQDVWPILYQWLLSDAGFAGWTRRFGISSVLSDMFNITVKTRQPGRAMAAAHFDMRDIRGRWQVLGPGDDAFYSCAAEECFIWARERAKHVQDNGLKTAQRVLVLGGAMDAALRTRGFIPGQNGQTIDIYDIADCRADMEIMLGGKLEDFGITYHIGSFMEIFKNPEFWNRYDLVTASGILSYYWEMIPQLLVGIRQLLTQGGKFVFDLQLTHLTYLFTKEVHSWPAGNMVLKGLDETVSHIEHLSNGCGMPIVGAPHYIPDCLSGVGFVLQKS